MPSAVLIAGESDRCTSLPLESTQSQEIKCTEGFLPFSSPGAGEGGRSRGEMAQESRGAALALALQSLCFYQLSPGLCPTPSSPLIPMDYGTDF